MAEEPNNETAFPAMTPGGYCTPGMSIRDWFAGQALAQLVHRREMTDVETYSKPDLAAEAYHYADAMLKAREPKPDTVTPQHIALGIGGGK